MTIGVSFIACLTSLHPVGCALYMRRYLVESTHGAGSPQAQRVLIARLMDVNSKKDLAKHLAGVSEV